MVSSTTPGSYERNAPSRNPHPYRPEPKWEARDEVQRPPRALPARPRELVVAILLAVLADVALFRARDIAIRGLGSAVFFVAVPIFIVVAARVRRASVRFGAIVAILLAIAGRCAYAPNVGTVVLGLVSVFALAITLRSRSAFLTDVAAAFGGTLVTLPRKLAGAVEGLRRSISGGGEKSAGERLAPVLVPFFLVSIFIGIFGLANPLVAKWLVAAQRAVHLPSGMRAVLWLFYFGGALLLLRPAMATSSAPEAAECDDDASKGSRSVAQNALVALNALFLMYNALDATYLWAGSPPPGVSERAYAHQGAAWLTVAIAVLTFVVGIMFRGALAHDAKAKLARVLAFAWLGQGLVLALGTFRRLGIHITTSGLSSIRILGMMGTGLVVVGLVQVGVKLLRRRTFTWLVRRQLDALVLGLLAFSILPTHLVSAGINVHRVMEREYQALVHVEEEVVEVESAAALLPIVGHEDERIRRGMAALLLNERDALRERTTGLALLDRDYATTTTLRALENATPELEAVLGDVERADAIVPFEYIRNSAIEGEIAQSEISKVERAQTRGEKFVRTWIAEQSMAFVQRQEAPGTKAIFHPAADANHLEVSVFLVPMFGDGPKKVAEVVLVLRRNTVTRQWQFVEERAR